LIEAVRKFEAQPMEPAVCRANAGRFSVERFQQELVSALQTLIASR